DTLQYDYQLRFYISNVTMNIQDHFGYIQLNMSAVLYDKNNQELYRKELFALDAEETKMYGFKQGVKKSFALVVDALMNDPLFLSKMKRQKERDHKKIEKIVVAKVEEAPKKIDTTPKKPTMSNGLPISYFQGCARLKSSKGFFVGFILADAGYVLTNGNNIPEGESTVYVKVYGQKTMKGKVLRRGAETNVVLIQIQSNKTFHSLDLAKASPAKNDTTYLINPGKTYKYVKGLYQNEIAVDRKYYHTVKTIPPKNADGAPLINSQGEVIGILDESVIGNQRQKKEFFIPIKDALRDLNLKLE
ncbi:serine protease, partial [Cyclobacteriaceae bacterium]|nr:serine protease [Cyclobacteriaceae bacterium]